MTVDPWRWDGPSLSTYVRWRVLDEPGGVLYRYEDGHGKKCPAYESNEIRVSVFYVEMGRPLDGLSDRLALLPGYLRHETIEPGRIERGGELRPQVRAWFAPRGPS